MSRRRFPVVLAALAGALVPAAPVAAKGFSHGVASAEVTASSARVWTRADRSGLVALEVDHRKAFHTPVVRRRLKAVARNDRTVQTVVRGLKPNTRYYFRFTRPGARSARGTFVTAPRASQSKTVRFAFSGDADATPGPNGKPFWNDFGVYERMAREHNAFNINLGDTIYSDSEVGAAVTNGQFKPPTVARTKSQKWAKYRANLAMKPLQRVRSTGSMYNQWDDHEFINDFTMAESGKAVYAAGVTAFRQYMPVTYSKRNGIYRSFRWGKNLELFFLDERSFRSAKASAGGACDNPQTGAPDLAPTLPKDKRDFFGLVVPSLNAPVSQRCLDAINSPSRTLLGTRQEKAFLSAVKRSTATFKVIVNEVPIQRDYALPYDFWEGYAFERTRVLDGLKGVRNVVWMATDHHAVLVTDVRYSTFPSEGGLNSTGMMEFATGPAATQTYGNEFDLATNTKGTGDLARNLFLKPAPPDGVGLDCANVDVYSYAQVSVSSKALKVAMKDIHGRPVKDGNSPCGPFTVAAK